MERVVEIPPGVGLPSAGGAYWRQRDHLARERDRIVGLFRAVESAGDLLLFQWAQLLALTLDFAPDLIIELGRGYGNSTCLFTEALHQLGGEQRRVVSLCNFDGWRLRTRPRLEPLVGPAWFAPLDARECDILREDYATLVAESRRCLVFWDAHGFDIAECVLGNILPAIADKEHLVAMHDLSDGRYGGPETRYYGERSLWRGNNWDGPRVRLGNIDSAVEQSVAILDFTSRNDVHLHSADESIRTEIGADPARVEAMRATLGEDMFALQAHWFWFSLNERAGTFTFPRYRWARTREGRLAALTS